MRRHRIRAEQFAQMMRDALGHSARVHENQGRPVRVNQLHETMIDFLPNFVRHHRFKRRLGNFDRQIQFAAMADVDDLAIGVAGIVHCTRTDQKTGNLLDRFLRRGQTDSLEWLFR